MGEGEETLVGYDVPAARSSSTARAPAAPTSTPPSPGGTPRRFALDGGLLRLRILVDRSSVEVFGGDGRAVVSDRVFPKPTSRGVAAFAEGGAAEIVSLRAWPLAEAIRR